MYKFQQCFNVDFLWGIAAVGAYYIDNFSDDVPALANFSYTSSGGYTIWSGDNTANDTVSVTLNDSYFEIPFPGSNIVASIDLAFQTKSGTNFTVSRKVELPNSVNFIPTTNVNFTQSANLTLATDVIFSNEGTLSVDASNSNSDIEVTLNISDDCHILFDTAVYPRNAIYVVGAAGHTATLTISGDKGIIGPDSDNYDDYEIQYMYLTNGIFKTNSELQVYILVHNSNNSDTVEIYFTGTLAPHCEFYMQANTEIILPDPYAYFAIQNTYDDYGNIGIDPGITAKNATVTLGTENSEPVIIDFASNDMYQMLGFNGTATLNLQTDVTFNLNNSGAFLSTPTIFNINGNGHTLTLTAENVTSSADIYSNIMSGVSEKLYLKGVNLVLAAAPSEAQGDGSASFRYKRVMDAPLNMYLEPDSDGNPSTFTAGTHTLYPRLEYDVISDTTALMGLFLSGNSTANFAKDSFNKWLILSADAEAEVNYSGDAKFYGLTGGGTVITEQEDGEYLFLDESFSRSGNPEGDETKVVVDGVGRGTVGFNAFTGIFTANNVMFGKDLTTYPFMGNENAAITDSISITKKLDIAGRFDSVDFYLKTLASKAKDVAGTGGDNDYRLLEDLLDLYGQYDIFILCIGNIYASDDLTIGDLYVDAGNSEDVVAILSAAEGKTLTINEAFFYDNAESTGTPYDNLRAVQIEGEGTVVINSASGGELADPASSIVGVAEDAITVASGTLFLSGDVGNSNITVRGGTLEVANGINLLGSLKFEDESEFVTEITSAQRNGAYAVKTNGDLTIEGSLSVDVTYDLKAFNGAEKGDEYRILGTNGTLTATSAAIASETSTFSADIIEQSSGSGVTPGVVLKVAHDFVVPVLGQASIEGSSGWNKINKWAENQFYFSVPVEGIDSGYFVSKDGDPSYYLKANPVALDSNVTGISDVTFTDGKLSFKGTFSGTPANAARGESFTIQIGLYWDNNPETSSPAVADSLTAISLVNVSYDVVFLKNILNSRDVIAAFTPAETPAEETPVDEYSTAEVLAKSNPEVNPFDEEVVFTVDGLTASTLTNNSYVMELVNGIYQPIVKSLNPIIVYSLPVDNGKRTFDKIQVLVNGEAVANEDANVDVSVSPAEVTVKVSALGYNGEVTVNKELAVRGIKTDGKTITTEPVTFRIVSRDLEYEVVPEEILESQAIADSSGDVVDFSAVLDAPSGFEFVAEQTIRFIIPLPDWLECTVTPDSIIFELKRYALVNAKANYARAYDVNGSVTLNGNLNEIDEVPVHFAVQVVDSYGNVSWRGYKWVIHVVRPGSTEYTLEVSGDAEAAVKENEIADYSLLVMVDPEPRGINVSFDYDAAKLPAWLKGTVSGSTLEFTAVEGASDEVGAVYEFDVFASVDSKDLTPVTVTIEVVSGDAPLPPAPAGFVIRPVSGSLTPTVSVGKVYELVLRAENADHWMIYDSEEAPEWLGFEENGAAANFSIAATEAQLADSPHTFVVHAYAGDYETSANLTITVVSGEVPAPSSPDVPVPSSPDVSVTGITGITGTKSVTANVSGSFTFTLGTSGTPSGTVTWTASGTGVAINSTANGVITGTVPVTASEAAYTITVTASDDVKRVIDTLTVTMPGQGGSDEPTTPTYTLTGFTSSSDVSVYAGARFSIPVTITGTAPTANWTAAVSGDAFTVNPTSGYWKTFTLTGTAPMTAGTYQITLRATYGNLTPITKTVTLVVNRIRTIGENGGGCDAGFGALALALAAPLFLRKIKSKARKAEQHV